MMLNSPRTRRLNSDAKALAQLAADSSIFSFQAFGSPADFYILKFAGRGMWKRNPQDEPIVRDEHEVHIRLGASYPRMMPELAWKSPIFHPNISASGVVCLGGYGTYWVPSLALDELCGMLWDMLRYENFDEMSPYNREAAAWAKHQTSLRLPLDPRPLRDKLSHPQKGPFLSKQLSEVRKKDDAPRRDVVATATRAAPPSPAPSPAPELLFIGETEVLDAPVAIARSAPQREVLYIE
jgi:ubiquitin-protein ligase